MLAAIGLAVVVFGAVVGIVMGVRILQRSRGQGAVPERWMGLALLFVCAGGYPMLVLAFVAPGAELRFALAAIAIAAVHAGLGCIFGFTRRVFRPDVAWLRGAAAVLALVLAVVSLGTVAAYWEGRGTLDAMMKAGEPWAYATNGIGDVIFAWTALESFRYWNLLRRRVPLGLADPLVANRFFLWGVFGAVNLAADVVNLGLMLRGGDVLQDPPSFTAVVVLSLASAGSLWMAFLPPKAWAAFVRRRSEALR